MAKSNFPLHGKVLHEDCGHLFIRSVYSLGTLRQSRVMKDHHLCSSLWVAPWVVRGLIEQGGGASTTHPHISFAPNSSTTSHQRRITSHGLTLEYWDGRTDACPICRILCNSIALYTCCQSRGINWMIRRSKRSLYEFAGCICHACVLRRDVLIMFRLGHFPQSSSVGETDAQLMWMD